MHMYIASDIGTSGNTMPSFIMYRTPMTLHYSQSGGELLLWKIFFILEEVHCKEKGHIGGKKTVTEV